MPEEKFYSAHPTNTDTLFDILGESRAIKTEDEIEVMRWATKITCEGHVEVLQKTKVGMREQSLDVIFKAYCDLNYFTGKIQPYSAIVCCGKEAATLHYLDEN